MANSKSARARRRAARERVARRQRRQGLLITGAFIVVVIGLIGVLGYTLSRPLPGLAMPDLGNEHIQPPERAEYNSYPPTSGPHYTSIAPWGIHETPIPNELQVHNLEDGGVMVQYYCPEGCEELVEQLSGVVVRYDRQVILAPYPDMEARIALTAWGRMDTLDAFDEARIVEFIEAYRGLDHHK